MNDENKIEQKPRDGQRTPMQWNSDQNNAGFSNATKPYHPLSKSWRTINVQNQLNSHLKVFQQLIQLRENQPFYTGKYRLILASKEIFSFIRYSAKSTLTPIYLVVINMIGAGRNDRPNECITMNFIDLLKCKDKNARGTTIIRSYNVNDDRFLSHEENSIDLNKISLRTSESIVLKLNLTINETHLSQR